MSEVNSLYALTIEASRDPVTGEVTSEFLLPRTFIVRRDSGVQNVWANMKHALARAMRFKSPFRELAIKMVMADMEGVLAISSEGGAYVKEFNTTRTSLPIGGMVGQPVSDLDMYMYENVMGNKGKFKNNPKVKGFGVDI